MNVIPTALALLVIGCQGGVRSTPAKTGEAAPGASASAELRFDETIPVGTLRFRLLELDDSRCPQGVKCVWEGQAAATVEVSAEDLTAQKVELTLRPGVEPAAEAVLGHELRLLDVEPYPREGVKVERSTRVITLEIRPL